MADVKYAWQYGPYQRPVETCNHKQAQHPYNDTFAVLICDGERDECICRECGTVKSFRCNFDEEYK